MSEVEPTVPSITIQGETFHARQSLNGARILHYGAALGRGGIRLYAAIEDFFAEVFDPEEHERFRAFIESDSRDVTVQELGDAFDKGLANYMSGNARPTPPPTP